MLFIALLSGVKFENMLVLPMRKQCQ